MLGGNIAAECLAKEGADFRGGQEVPGLLRTQGLPAKESLRVIEGKCHQLVKWHRSGAYDLHSNVFFE
jgi:hypothetical protein